MSRIKIISIICLLFLTTLVFTSFGGPQTAANNNAGELEIIKQRMGMMGQEETRLRENESQLAAQLQIEQAKLAELDDQLDALRRELETPPAENKQPQGGKRP